MTSPLIRVEGLCKRYETAAMQVPALVDVTLSVQPGEFVAVMGPSGSGKSTFMNLLGLLDIASAGRYWLADEDTGAMTPDGLAGLRNRAIGFVFQGFNLLARMSALDNVALPLIYAGVEARDRRERAAEMIARVGLEKFAQFLPTQLSGGQQQRIAIARALINRPPLLLADEPTGNLDTQTGGQIMDLLTRLNAEHRITLLLVTHEPDIARHARRLVRFLDGRVVHDGPVAEGLRLDTPLPA